MKPSKSFPPALLLAAVLPLLGCTTRWTVETTLPTKASSPVTFDGCHPLWTTQGTAVQHADCSALLVPEAPTQQGELVLAQPLPTQNLQVRFTMTASNSGSLPADGFAVVLGDPTLGATPSTLGGNGWGLGASGIPGLVFGFDAYQNGNEPTIPYAAIGRGELAQWEQPWQYNSAVLPPIAVTGQTLTHSYVVSVVNGTATVSMDGQTVLTGAVTAPPSAYLYITASTGLHVASWTVSNISVTYTPAP